MKLHRMLSMVFDLTRLFVSTMRCIHIESTEMKCIHHLSSLCNGLNWKIDLQRNLNFSSAKFFRIDQCNQKTCCVENA